MHLTTIDYVDAWKDQFNVKNTPSVPGMIVSMMDRSPKSGAELAGFHDHYIMGR